MKDPASISRVFVFLTFPPNRFPSGSSAWIVALFVNSLCKVGDATLAVRLLNRREDMKNLIPRRPAHRDNA
jgi:hypothetical protein